VHGDEQIVGAGIFVVTAEPALSAGLGTGFAGRRRDFRVFIDTRGSSDWTFARGDPVAKAQLLRCVRE
jgi:hypothetical protein